MYGLGHAVHEMFRYYSVPRSMCWDSTPHLILSRWSYPGVIGIGGFGTKEFSRNSSKGHFVGSSAVRREKGIFTGGVLV